MNDVLVAALSGWFGVLLLVAAVACAVVADCLRQGTDPDGGIRPVRSTRSPVRGWTRAALLLTVAAAGGVVVRFLTVLVL